MIGYCNAHTQTVAIAQIVETVRRVRPQDRKIFLSSAFVLSCLRAFVLNCLTFKHLPPPPTI